MSKLGFFQSHTLRSGNNSIIFNFAFSIVHVINFLLHCRRKGTIFFLQHLFFTEIQCVLSLTRIYGLCLELNCCKRNSMTIIVMYHPIKYSVPSIFSLSASGFHSVNFFMVSGRTLAKISILISGFLKISRALNKKKQTILLLRSEIISKFVTINETSIPRNSFVLQFWLHLNHKLSADYSIFPIKKYLL